MKIYYKNRLIKRVKEKYQVIKNITDYLEDFEHIRPIKAEIRYLDQALFEEQISWLTLKFKYNEPLVYEQIQQAKPVKAYRVTTSDGQIYYSLEFSNGLSVRCPEQIFRIAPVKMKLKQTNSLSRQIAPPSVEQLRLFG